MATSAGSLYALQAGVFNLTRVSPAPGIFPVKTRVNLNNGKVAVYAIAGGTIAPSTSALALATLGTASAGASAGSAGPWIAMNEITASAGEYIWLRTSADEVLP